jgi:hypothetical protein
VPVYSPPVFPEFGPDDTAEEAASVKSDFKASFYVWYTTQWHSYYKEPVIYAGVADSAPEIRRQLDEKLAAAIPRLQAQLREAEAAAARLSGKQSPRLTGVPAS